MASRPELVECCIELNIDWHGLSINEMKELIRKEADRRWKNRTIRHSANGISVALKKFLTLEYDYRLLNSEGKEIKMK